MKIESQVTGDGVDMGNEDPIVVEGGKNEDSDYYIIYFENYWVVDYKFLCLIAISLCDITQHIIHIDKMAWNIA